MRIPHPIPYQGSKRNIAKFILPYFFKNINTLIEPFAGSAAITIATAQARKASRYYINDINEPLILLVKEIVENPYRIAEEYDKLWHDQIGNERKYYDGIRDSFNRDHRPEHFLYLLARCVKASIRYNLNGEFNQSPDNRRKGRNPREMRNDIIATSQLLSGKTIFSSNDYKKVLEFATPYDLIYMDPPYQGVSNKKDPRYIEGVKFNELIEELDKLNKKNIPFILSYDGRRGNMKYGSFMPEFLDLHHLEIEAGRSTQSTLLGGDEITIESLYISQALINKLPFQVEETESSLSNYTNQLELVF